MTSRRIKRIMSYAIVVVAVLIGMTFVMSDSASAQVLPSGAVIVRPAFNQPFVAPRPMIVPKPFVGSFFNPFGFHPFFNRPFFNPFLFEEEPFFFGIEERPFFGEAGFEAD